MASTSVRARPVNVRTELNVLAMLLQAKQSYTVIQRMLTDQANALEMVFDEIEEQECHLKNCKEDLAKIRGLIDKLIEKCASIRAGNRLCNRLKKAFNRVFSQWVAAWKALHQVKKEIAEADEKEEETENNGETNNKEKEET
ncbi:unnamed protein product [Bursaphelenchus xylophilus]|uniref:(pine wood nematode) hypothetical protein n=1 Tax=Bursaphelenchus xylophilus TaxID=6326 RepID=A0A1I7SV88_BURXY|nr:unnamed protein product [Bursaphelenchus xylophilus]CAG9101072.1 unnamed protein product [Bursaphelenchus xylophilus]